MAWNGTGTYSRIHNWVADAAVPIDITASRMDAEDDSIAAGINNCIAKDGQNTATANLPMGSFKHTNVGASADRTDYARVAELQDGTHSWEGTDGGAANAYTITPSPAITAYAAGQTFSFKPANDNTGASTLAVSGLATKDIKLIDGADPVAGDIDASGVCVVQYDGTNFVLLNPATPDARLTRETSQATSSGTNVNFSGLPAWAKKISVMFDAVGSSLQGSKEVRLGDSGGIETTNYSGCFSRFVTGTTVVGESTSGTIITPTANNQTWSGNVHLANVTGNVWTMSSVMTSRNTGTKQLCVASYVKTLSAALTQLDIDLASGAFNNGNVNVLVQG